MKNRPGGSGKFEGEKRFRIELSYAKTVSLIEFADSLCRTLKDKLNNYSQGEYR